MLIPTLIMGFIAMSLMLIGYYKGEGQHIVGLKLAMSMTIEILPLLLFAFMVAGMVQVLIPQVVVTKWIGTESGMRGIMIGSLAGGLTPGGPYVSLPIVAGLMRSGASLGTTVAFITGWSLLAISRLPMEVGILGWRFTLIRFASIILFPPLAGLIAEKLFANTTL